MNFWHRNWLNYNVICKVGHLTIPPPRISPLSERKPFLILSSTTTPPHEGAERKDFNKIFQSNIAVLTIDFVFSTGGNHVKTNSLSAPARATAQISLQANTLAITSKSFLKGCGEDAFFSLEWTINLLLWNSIGAVEIKPCRHFFSLQCDQVLEAKTSMSCADRRVMHSEMLRNDPSLTD